MRVVRLVSKQFFQLGDLPIALMPAGPAALRPGLFLQSGSVFKSGVSLIA